MSSLLEIGNKSINKIQEILWFAKAKNLSKQAISIMGNLIILFQSLLKDYNCYFREKHKRNNKEQYFNYYKFRHFDKNYE